MFNMIFSLSLNLIRLLINILIAIKCFTSYLALECSKAILKIKNHLIPAKNISSGDTENSNSLNMSQW